MKWARTIAAAAMAVLLAPSVAQADSSIGAVEGARARERQGAYLTRQDRDNLRRHGGNDDYGRRYGYAPYVYDGGYYDDGHYDDDEDYDDDEGPGVGIYLGD